MKNKKLTFNKHLSRILLLSSFGLILFIIIIYLVSLSTSGAGSFTIKAGGMNDGRVLSLSETKGLANPTIKLHVLPMDGMTNITFTDIDVDTISKGEGSNNGENYLAYSFYAKNSGEKELVYKAHLDILEASRNIDAAIRIIICKNDQRTIYAKANDVTGVEEIYPDNVKNFLSEKKVFENDNKLSPGEMDKYTIIIWLEGEDPECIDSVIKGYLQMEFNADVLGEENEMEIKSDN